MATNLLNLISKYRNALMGVAMIFVILYHIRPDTGCVILNGIIKNVTGAVDVLIFLSGFSLYFSCTKPGQTYSNYYKTRFLRVFPPFWFFLLVKFLITGNYSIKSVVSLLVKATTLGLWIPGAPYELWFISCIVVFYIIFPLYIRQLQKRGHIVTIAYIIIGLLLTLIYALIMVYAYDNVNKGRLIVLAISRIPVFFIGAFFGYLVKDQIKIKTSHIVMILFSSMIGVVLYCIFKKYFQEYLLTCSLYFLPWILITPGFCIIISWIFSKIPSVFSLSFSKIGALSLELYLVHEYTISLIREPLSNYCLPVQIAAYIFFISLPAIGIHYLNTFLQKRINR